MNRLEPPNNRRDLLSVSTFAWTPRLEHHKRSYLNSFHLQHTAA